MGLLTPVILGALLIVAFALSSQQRLALASHDAPMPARQIAYQMRVHHWAAIRLKQADHDLDTVVDALNDDDFLFVSCIKGNDVMTVMMTIAGVAEIPRLVIGSAEANVVVQELARQAVVAPELGRIGATSWSVGYNGSTSALITPVMGIGLTALVSDTIQTTIGAVPMPPCLVPDGAPAILTQVVP